MTTTGIKRTDTLGEASQNPDGTYNGAKALKWLHEVFIGKPIEESEIMQMWEQEKRKKNHV